MEVVNPSPLKDEIEVRQHQEQLNTAGMPKVGQIYEHYRGGQYEVVETSLFEETLDPCVTYRSLSRGWRWTRTVRVFQQQVIVDGVLQPRFKLVEESQPDKRDI